MKRDYIYLMIIGFLIIMLGVSVSINIKLNKNDNTSDSQINKVICKKNNLSDNKYTFNDIYELEYNKVGKLEKVNYSKIYQNISENNYLDVAREIEEDKDGKTGFVCSYLNHDKSLKCSIETRTFKDESGNISTVWYYTYIRNLEKDNYTCEY